MSEQWRVVVGHHNYMVSDEGKIKSLARTVRVGIYAHRSIPETVLTPIVKRSTGYAAVMMDRCQVLVHIAVLTAFVGPPPTRYHQCAHGDGVRTTNRLANLRWATAKENQHDRRAHGTLPFGQHVHTSKLTEDDVLRIRGDHRSRVQVAQDYGVTPEAISAIVHRRNWGWLKAEHMERTA